MFEYVSTNLFLALHPCLKGNFALKVLLIDIYIWKSRYIRTFHCRHTVIRWKRLPVIAPKQPKTLVIVMKDPVPMKTYAPVEKSVAIATQDFL